MPGLEVTLTHPLLHPGPPFPQWGVLSAPVPGTLSVSLSLKRKCLDSHGGGCGASPLLASKVSPSSFVFPTWMLTQVWHDL